MQYIVVCSVLIKRIQLFHFRNINENKQEIHNKMLVFEVVAGIKDCPVNCYAFIQICMHKMYIAYQVGYLKGNKTSLTYTQAYFYFPN